MQCIEDGRACRDEFCLNICCSGCAQQDTSSSIWQCQPCVSDDSIAQDATTTRQTSKSVAWTDIVILIVVVAVIVLSFIWFRRKRKHVSSSPEASPRSSFESSKTPEDASITSSICMLSPITSLSSGRTLSIFKLSPAKTPDEINAPRLYYESENDKQVIRIDLR